jgi:hypothetical protein
MLSLRDGVVDRTIVSCTTITDGILQYTSKYIDQNNTYSEMYHREQRSHASVSHNNCAYNNHRLQTMPATIVHRQW